LLTLHFHKFGYPAVVGVPDAPDISCDAFGPAVPVFHSAVDIESLLWPPILTSLMLVGIS
jgi:hypothetical protein